MKNISGFKKGFFCFLLSAVSIISIAQERKSQLELIASFQPLYLASDALHFDIEVKRSRLLNFIISPEFYNGYAYDKSFFASARELPSDRVGGAGIGLAHKISLAENPSKPYLSYGLMYRKINVDYQDEGYVPQQRDGLDYFEYGPFSDRLKINSFLLSFCAGVQTTGFGRFGLDFYAGFGYKISSTKSQIENERRYNQDSMSFAYNGFTMLAGIKAGFKLK